MAVQAAPGDTGEAAANVAQATATIQDADEELFVTDFWTNS